MVFKKCGLFMLALLIQFFCLLSTGADTTTNGARTYSSRNVLRLVPAGAPTRAELVDTYSYRSVTTRTSTTYITVPSDDDDDDDDDDSGSFSSGVAVYIAPSGGGTMQVPVTSEIVISDRVVTESAVVSSSPFSPPSGALSPSGITHAGQRGRDARLEGLGVGTSTNALTSSSTARNSLLATVNIPVTATVVEDEAKLRAALEDSLAFADTYGDPVKLATGSLSLRATDVQVVMPGRAENFSIIRDYDSSSVVSGFFGIGWSTGMESRLFLGRDEPHWVAPGLIFHELAILNATIQQLDATWNNERTIIADNVHALRNIIDNLSSARASYSSAASAESNAALRAAYTLLADRSLDEIAHLQPLLAQLENHFHTIQNNYNEERAGLAHAIVELENRLAYSQEQIGINEAIRNRNIPLLFPGQLVNMDKIGTDSIMLYPLFGGNRNYLHDVASSSNSQRVYRSDRNPLDLITLSDDGAHFAEMGGFSVEYDARGRVRSRSLNDTLLYSFVQGSMPGPDMIRLYGERNISIEWNDHSPPKIASISDDRGVIRRYIYDGNYLYRVLYPDGSLDQYQYQLASPTDTHRRLHKLEYFTSADEAEPAYSRMYEYDSEGRTIAAEDSRGLDEEFAYYLNGNSIERASYTNSSGITSSYSFDARLLQTAIASPLEGDTQFTRDGNGKITAVDVRRDDGYHATTFFSYSAIGTLATITGPTGGLYEMNYNDRGQMIYSRDPDGIAASYFYDGRGNISLILNGDGSRKQYQYNSDNLCTQYIDEEGMRWHYEYSDYGYLRLIRDPSGAETLLAYDPYGRILSVTSPEGAQWQYEYDARGVKRAEVDPLGFRRETNLAEVDENPVATTHRALWSEEIFQDGFPGTMSINALDIPASIIWSDGGIWRYRYSPGGQLISAEDPNGEITHYTYTVRGFPEAIRHPDGTVESRHYDRRGLLVSQQDQNGITTNVEYDRNGRLAAVVDEAGSRSMYRRDRDGRITELIEGVSSDTPYGLRHRRYAYDAAGNIITIEEGLNKVTRFEYDRQSRLITVRDPAGFTTQHSYTDNSRETRDAMERIKTYYFDEAERLTAYENSLGQRTDYTYTEDVVSINTPSDNEWTSIYDPQGRLIERHYPDGSVEKTAYNDRGQIHDQSIGNRRHRYTYDPRGNLIREVTEKGEEYRYQYDEINNRVREEYPGGYVIEKEYNGRLLVSSRDNLGDILIYQYGDDGRLKIVRDGSGKVLQAYGYDALGRLIFASTGEIQSHFQWNVHNQLVYSYDSLSNMEVSYDYDWRGNLISVQDDSGFQQDREYNLASEISTMHISAGGVDTAVTISRDEAGRPLLMQANELVTQRLQYNNDGLQSLNTLATGNQSDKSSSENIFFAELYAYDSSYRRQYHIDQQARLTLYEYDSQNQLSALYSRYRESSPKTQHWPNPDQAMARKLTDLWQESQLPGFFTAYQGMEKETFTYNSSNTADITFDSKGNVLSWEDADGKYQLTYDSFNRLASLQVKKVTATISCRYVYDALSRLAMEVCESEKASSSANTATRNTGPATREPATREATETGSYAIVYVHQGLLPRPYVQLQYNETLSQHHENTSATSPEQLDRRLQSSRYRYNSGGRSSNFTTLKLPAASPFPGRLPDLTIWYSYRNSSIQTASLLQNNAQQAPRNYLLSEDGNRNTRAVTDLQSGESRVLEYGAYGESRVTDERIPSPLFPGFAGVIQNRVTGLSYFGYRLYSPRLRRFLSGDPLRSGYDWFAYSDNDPINYRDVLGLQRQSLLLYDVLGERLHGFFYDEEDGKRTNIVPINIYTTNNLRDRQNPTADNTPEGEIIYSSHNDPTQVVPYIPQKFPAGPFTIVGIEEKNTEDYGAHFIGTSATQQVPVREQHDDGVWRPKIDSDGNVVTIADYGYGFHAGGYTKSGGHDPMTKNDPNDTTRGCGRQSTQDNAILAGYVQTVIKEGGTTVGCAYYHAPPKGSPVP